jgi:uncharacterized protein YpuA (DUF1002 family)
MIPPSCTETKFDITACSADLPGVIENLPEDKKEKIKTCLMNLATINIDFGDIQKTIQKGIEIGTDILKGTGIKF